MKRISPIQERLDFILPNLKNIKSGSKIIDLGCGTGILSKEIYDRTHIKVVGIDLDKNNIIIAKKKCPQNNYKCMDIQNIKNKIRPDFIICSEVLEHLPNPKELLVKIHDLIDSDCVVLITIPNGYGSWELFENQPLELIRNFITNKPKLKKIYYGARDKLGFGAKDSVNLDVGSRHLQRFTLKKIKRLFKESKFKIVIQKNTHFLSALLPFRLIRSIIPPIYYLDNWICRWLAPSFSSGWGFLIKKKK